MNDLKTQILAHIDAAASSQVWTPTDFSHLGSRDAVDKALQRLVAAGQLRRIDRGLYDQPRVNSLTKKTAAPDYRAIVDAIARRDQLRLLVDGMTAANDLGLTDAVPAPQGDLFEWDEASTYVRKPPYFINMQRKPSPVSDIAGARVLAGKEYGSGSSRDWAAKGGCTQ